MMDVRRSPAFAATSAVPMVRAKAPTLAWLLTALTCFLAGLALGEGRHQVAAPPALAPPTATVAVAATATAEPTLLPTLTPTPTPGPVIPWNYG